MSSATKPRTQADRSAATRARIVEAVIACIDEVGFARTTAQRIARRAGVSVGAVQHHFASKTEILDAVLQDSFARLAAAFDGELLQSGSLEERVHGFVERAWRHYGSTPFRSSLEILLSTRERTESEDVWLSGPLVDAERRAEGLWSRVFSDLAIPRERSREILRFAFTTLAGFGMITRLDRREQAMKRQLELLEVALVAMLERARTDTAAE